MYSQVFIVMFTSVFQRWQEKKDEETKKQMAENGRYKAYRRYMRQHGPGRITFDDS